MTSTFFTEHPLDRNLKIALTLVGFGVLAIVLSFRLSPR